MPDYHGFGRFYMPNTIGRTYSWKMLTIRYVTCCTILPVGGKFCKLQGVAGIYPCSKEIEIFG